MAEVPLYTFYYVLVLVGTPDSTLRTSSSSIFFFFFLVFTAYFFCCPLYTELFTLFLSK